MATRTQLNRPQGGIQKVPKKSLFDEDSGDEDGAAGDPPSRTNNLTINEEFAKRFEHNKKREELHRLEEKYKSKKPSGAAEDGDEDGDEDSSSDESEDEDAFLITDELDGEISATLQAIKNKDPRIYDKNTIFYKPFDPDVESEAAVKKEKPVFLRDYHRERYMRGDVGEDAEGKEEQNQPQTYAEEQDDLKQEILSQIRRTEVGQDSEEDDDEEFVQRKETAVKAGNGVHPSRAAAIKLTELDVAKADENPEEYLSKFLESNAWRAEDGPKWQAFESDEEDGDGNDLAEQFEHAYNMRFEDPEKSNEMLKSYSRNVVAARSLRREEPKGRKKQRQLEKEKKEAEKMERDEERARLRRLKVEEASEKLRKIKQAAGMSGKALREDEWMRFLDDAWEDDKWEEEMKRRFGEEYYAEADDMSAADDEGGEISTEISSKKRKKKPTKPKWDDDIDIKDIIPDFDDEARPNITLTDSEDEDEETSRSQKKRKVTESDEADEVDSNRPSKKHKSAKEQRKERAEATKKARQELSKIEALVDVRMKLDDPTALTGPASSSKTNPDTAAVPLFRYRETSPNTFGMTARDILLAPSDASLNQFAGLKKLAAFRDEEKKRRDKKRLGKKARLREWRRETFGPQFEHTGPTYGFVDAGGRRGEEEPGADHGLLEAPPAGDAKAEDNVVEGEGRKKRKKKLKRNRPKGKKAVTTSAED